jgi:peptidoglycan/xylan/chitin deacetylase (PgdA/CDA1 family)
LPEKPFLVTFDDGYCGVYDFAAPVLGAMNWPYTVFLVTDLIGKSNEWDAEKGIPPLGLMDWKRIEDLDRNSLASFQPHTKTHIHLSKAIQNDARMQIFGSRDDIEQHLGKKAHVFCYPYGDQNEQTVQIVSDAGFELAVTTDFGRVREGDRGLKMPRVAVHHVPPVSLTYGLAGPNFWWRIKSRKDNRPLL